MAFRTVKFRVSVGLYDRFELLAIVNDLSVEGQIRRLMAEFAHGKLYANCTETSGFDGFLGF